MRQRFVIGIAATAIIAVAALASNSLGWLSQPNDSLVSRGESGKRAWRPIVELRPAEGKVLADAAIAAAGDQIVVAKLTVDQSDQKSTRGQLDIETFNHSGQATGTTSGESFSTSTPIRPVVASDQSVCFADNSSTEAVLKCWREGSWQPKRAIAKNRDGYQLVGTAHLVTVERTIYALVVEAPNGASGGGGDQRQATSGTRYTARLMSLSDSASTASTVLGPHGVALDAETRLLPIIDKLCLFTSTYGGMTSSGSLIGQIYCRSGSRWQKYGRKLAVTRSGSVFQGVGAIGKVPVAGALWPRKDGLFDWRVYSMRSRRWKQIESVHTSRSAAQGRLRNCGLRTWDLIQIQRPIEKGYESTFQARVYSRSKRRFGNPYPNVYGPAILVPPGQFELACIGSKVFALAPGRSSASGGAPLQVFELD